MIFKYSQCPNFFYWKPRNSVSDFYWTSFDRYHSIPAVIPMRFIRPEKLHIECPRRFSLSADPWSVYDHPFIMAIRLATFVPDDRSVWNYCGSSFSPLFSSCDNPRLYGNYARNWAEKILLLMERHVCLCIHELI